MRFYQRTRRDNKGDYMRAIHIIIKYSTYVGGSDEELSRSLFKVIDFLSERFFQILST